MFHYKSNSLSLKYEKKPFHLFFVILKKKKKKIKFLHFLIQYGRTKALRRNALRSYTLVSSVVHPYVIRSVVVCSGTLTNSYLRAHCSNTLTYCATLQ